MTKKKSAKKTARGSEPGGFSAEERAAMREHAKELKAAKAGKPSDEGAVLVKIAEMPQPDRGIAERVHAIVRATAPELSPRLWYGMPAYSKNGNVICFVQVAGKFKARYSTLGFNDKAKLDDGEMWPTAFALTRLTPAVEDRIAALVKKAAS